MRSHKPWKATEHRPHFPWRPLSGTVAVGALFTSLGIVMGLGGANVPWSVSALVLASTLLTGMSAGVFVADSGRGTHVAVATGLFAVILAYALPVLVLAAIIVAAA